MVLGVDGKVRGASGTLCLPRWGRAAGTGESLCIYSPVNSSLQAS